MANVISKYTNLPMSLYFSEKPDNHKIRPVRFKISPNLNKFINDDTVIDYLISEDDTGNAVHIESVNNKHLSSKHTKLLEQYIKDHYRPIVCYWESDIDTILFIDKLRNHENNCKDENG